MEAAGLGTEESRPGPTGAADSPPSLPLDSLKQTASLFVAEMVPFGVLAQFRGAHWKVSKEEAAQLAPLWAEVLDKYYPDWYLRAGPEVQLAMVLGVMIFTRYQIEKQLLVEIEKKAGPASASGGNGAPPGTSVPSGFPSAKL